MTFTDDDLDAEGAAPTEAGPKVFTDSDRDDAPGRLPEGMAFASWQDLKDWKPRAGFGEARELGSWLKIRKAAAELGDPDRAFGTVEEFNKWLGKPRPGPSGPVSKPVKRPRQPVWPLGEMQQRARTFKPLLDPAPGYEVALDREGGGPVLQYPSGSDFKPASVTVGSKPGQLKPRVVGVRREDGESVEGFNKRASAWVESEKARQRAERAETAQVRARTNPERGRSKYVLGAIEGLGEVFRQTKVGMELAAGREPDAWTGAPMPMLNEGQAGEFGVKVAQGAGSMAGFGMMSALGGGPGVMGFMGAASNAASTYEEARSRGVSHDEALAAAVPGALIGSLEAAGGGGGRATGLLGGTLGEIGQEVTSQALNNINAKIVSGFDPKRAITEGLVETAAIAGLLGGGAHGAGAVASHPAAQRGWKPAIASEIESIVEPVSTVPVTFASFRPTDLALMEGRARDAGRPVALTEQTLKVFEQQASELKGALMAADPTGPEFQRLADQYTQLQRAIEDAPAPGRITDDASLREWLLETNMMHEGAVEEVMERLRPPVGDSPLAFRPTQFNRAWSAPTQGARFYPLRNDPQRGGTVYLTRQSMLDAGLVSEEELANVGALNVPRDVAVQLATKAVNRHPDVSAVLFAANEEAYKKGLPSVSIVGYVEGQGLRATRQLLRHESFHTGQQVAADSTSPLEGERMDPLALHSPELVYHPTVQQVAGTTGGQTILNHYQGDMQALAYEMAAYTAAGQWDYIGVDEAQGIEYLTDYLTDLVESNGSGVLEALVSGARLGSRTAKLIGGLKNEHGRQESERRAKAGGFAASLRSAPSLSEKERQKGSFLLDDYAKDEDVERILIAAGYDSEARDNTYREIYEATGERVPEGYSLYKPNLPIPIFVKGSLLRDIIIGETSEEEFLAAVRAAGFEGTGYKQMVDVLPEMEVDEELEAMRALRKGTMTVEQARQKGLLDKYPGIEEYAKPRSETRRPSAPSGTTGPVDGDSEVRDGVEGAGVGGPGVERGDPQLPDGQGTGSTADPVNRPEYKSFSDPATGSIAELSLIENGQDFALFLPAGPVYFFNRLHSQKPGEGGGTKLLAEIRAFSDSTGVPVLNHVSAYGGLSQEDLVRFYEKNGFVRVEHPDIGDEDLLIYGPQLPPPADPPVVSASGQGPLPELFNEVLKAEHVRDVASKVQQAALRAGVTLDETLSVHMRILKAMAEQPDLMRANPEILEVLEAGGMTEAEFIQAYKDTSSEAGRTLQALQGDAEYIRNMVLKSPEQARQFLPKGVFDRQALRILQETELGMSLWYRLGGLPVAMALGRLSTTMTNILAATGQLALNAPMDMIAGLGHAWMNPTAYRRDGGDTTTARASHALRESIKPSLEVIWNLPSRAMDTLLRRKQATGRSARTALVMAEMAKVHGEEVGKLRNLEYANSSEPAQRKVFVELGKSMAAGKPQTAQQKQYEREWRRLEATDRFNRSRRGKLLAGTEWLYSLPLKPLVWQEMAFREPLFVASLDRALAAKGKSLDWMLANAHNQLAAVDLEVVREAVQTALTTTWGYKPELDNPDLAGPEQLAEDIGYQYIKYMNKLGPLNAAIGDLFARSTTNAVKFAWEWGPWGVVSPGWKIASRWRAGERDEISRHDAERVSKAIMGTAMYALAWSLMSSQPGDDEWYKIPTPFKDARGNPISIDIRLYPQLALPMRAADLMRRVKDGRLNDVKAWEELRKTYVNARNSRYGAEQANIFDEMLKYWSDGTDNERAWLAGQQGLGQLVSLPVTPLQNLTSLLAQWDPEQAYLRDTRSAGLLGPAMDKLPWLRNKLPVRQPFTEPAPQEMSARAGLIGPITNSLVPGLRTPAPLGFASREFARLGLKPTHFLAPDPDPVINRAQYASYAAQLEDLSREMEANLEYQRASAAEQAAMWEDEVMGTGRIVGIAELARQDGEAANPDEMERRKLLRQQGPLRNKADGTMREVQDERKRSKGQVK